MLVVFAIIVAFFVGKRYNNIMNKCATDQTIAILTDIHGNLPALRALLEYFDAVGCDRYINLGDIVDIGAYSRQCLDIMQSLPNCTNILGNHDWDFACDRRRHLPMSHTSGEHKAYVFDSIGSGYRDKVSQFVRSVTITHGEVTFAFMHYALAQDTCYGLFRQLVPHPNAELLDETFEGTVADVVFYGHKHEPSSIIGKRVYHDIGSVGCHRDSVARGALLTLHGDGGYTFERVSVAYDRDSYKHDMVSGSLPDGKYLFDFYLDRLEDKEN